MGTQNEAIVEKLKKKQAEEKAVETELEEAPEFPAGDYLIPKELSLELENIALKLDMLEMQKGVLKGIQEETVRRAGQAIGMPPHMKIVGGTTDFKKVTVKDGNE